jgi:Ran GTPase-activating protein (RanGAP) involved in mRNA processing and transport
MDYGKNKEAKGQNRATEETEMMVRANLSKDGKTLDLTATYLKEYGAKDVASFEFLNDLTTLELGTNLIGPKGAKYIAQSKTLTNLTTLNLYYNKIGNEGCKYIAISDNLQSLQNLILSDNDIGDEGAVMLAKFLPLFSNLVRLDMRLNKLRDEGREALKEAQKLSSVKHLLLDKVEGFQVKT